MPSRTLTRLSASRAGPRTASKSARIVATAARWIHDGRRLDMQGLADELGVSRVTLFRRVGSREELLSRALWLLTERDVEEFGLVTLIEPNDLAYALVRLGESFLYADVLAARKPDVATANRLQQALVEGILP